MLDERASSSTFAGASIGRRFAARSIDWLVGGALSAVACWPVAWWALERIVGAGFRDLVQVLIGAFTLQGAIGNGADRLLGLVVITLTAQVVVVAAYEWLATALTGTTAGKALLGVRVVCTTDIGPGRRRVTRLAARSALAVLPGGTVFVGLVAAVGIPGSLLAAAALALLVGYDLAGGLRAVGREGARFRHDTWTRTAVVRIDWVTTGKEVRQRAQQAVAFGADTAERARNSEPLQRILNSPGAGTVRAEASRAMDRGRAVADKVARGPAMDQIRERGQAVVRNASARTTPEPHLDVAPAQTPLPGWYPDPNGAGLRWWDGSSWTNYVHAQATASAHRPE